MIADVAARRLALVRWFEEEQRWELIFQARDMPSVGRLLVRRAKSYPGCHQVVLFCRRDDVGAAVAALKPPPFRQLPLFSEDRDGPGSSRR